MIELPKSYRMNVLVLKMITLNSSYGLSKIAIKIREIPKAISVEYINTLIDYPTCVTGMYRGSPVATNTRSPQGFRAPTLSVSL